MPRQTLFVSSAVDREFESWTGKIKDYKISICCIQE